MKNVYLKFDNVYLNETSIVTSLKEAKIYGKYYDYIYKDHLNNEKSYEKSEIQFLKTSLAILFKKTGSYNPDLFIGGDLTNQLSVSNQVSKQLNSSFIGLYSACGTLIIALIIASVFIDSNLIENSVCFTSSNYGSAERQFRYPIEYGGPKKETTTITTSGGVSAYLSTKKSKIKINRATIGKVEDIIWDNPFDMGSPMAYGAYKSIKAHLENFKYDFSDYDLILTGDLSKKGSKVLIDLFKIDGYHLNNHLDCGSMIFENSKEYFCGGSGCACIGIIGLSYIKKMMEEGKYKKVLLVGTGALHSKTSVDQKQSIPIVAHCIELERVNDLY